MITVTNACRQLNIRAATNNDRSNANCPPRSSDDDNRDESITEYPPCYMTDATLFIFPNRSMLVVATNA